MLSQPACNKRKYFPTRRFTRLHGDPLTTSENQIDHICINKKFRGSWKYVRMMRGVDISSEHHLLMTKVRLHFKNFTNTTNMQTYFNPDLLRTKNERTAFHLNLFNRFHSLQDQLENRETNIETQWQYIKELWRDTCKVVLGRRKTQLNTKRESRPIHEETG